MADLNKYRVMMKIETNGLLKTIQKSKRMSWLRLRTRRWTELVNL